jgi:hypothetical protein
MLDKTSAVQDPEANAKKADTDRRAAELIGVDDDVVRKDAKNLVEQLRKYCGNGPHEHTLNMLRIVIAGAAGSGKTSIAVQLAKELGVKNIDLDDFIPGGHTADKLEYERRFNRGLYEAWDSVPHKAGWIIEHIGACNKDLVSLYSPSFALLVDPGPERIRLAAAARAAVSDSGNEKDRLARALETEKSSRKQFDSLHGTVLSREPKGYILKALAEG